MTRSPLGRRGADPRMRDLYRAVNLGAPLLEAAGPLVLADGRVHADPSCPRLFEDGRSIDLASRRPALWRLRRLPEACWRCAHPHSKRGEEWLAVRSCLRTLDLMTAGLDTMRRMPTSALREGSSARAAHAACALGTIAVLAAPGSFLRPARYGNRVSDAFERWAREKVPVWASQAELERLRHVPDGASPRPMTVVAAHCEPTGPRLTPALVVDFAQSPRLITAPGMMIAEVPVAAADAPGLVTLGPTHPRDGDETWVALESLIQTGTPLPLALELARAVAIA